MSSVYPAQIAEDLSQESPLTACFFPLILQSIKKEKGNQNNKRTLISEKAKFSNIYYEVTYYNCLKVYLVCLIVQSKLWLTHVFRSLGSYLKLFYQGSKSLKLGTKSRKKNPSKCFLASYHLLHLLDHRLTPKLTFSPKNLYIIWNSW